MKRADQLLVERGLAATRSQAQRLIGSGVRWRLAGGQWRVVSKNGELLHEAAECQVLDEAQTRYVSRGGLKLEAALRRCALDVRAWRCLDVGQSTGGFTDCLLQHGAAQVVGVDVGQGQLHPRLAQDPRVLCIEKCNARELKPEGLRAHMAAAAGTQNSAFSAGEPWFDLIVGDLSFISQTLVWPALRALLNPPTPTHTPGLLMLVKPQFELSPAHIGKGGVVKNPAYHDLVRERMGRACDEQGLRLCDYFESPITGGDGNLEFFVWACP